MVLVHMTEEQFHAKAEELERTQGITVSGRVGTISQGGVTAAYTHAADTLTIHIVDLPTFVSQEYCELRITDWLGTTTPMLPPFRGANTA